jgi:hypothetical protein
VTAPISLQQGIALAIALAASFKPDYGSVWVGNLVCAVMVKTRFVRVCGQVV